MMPINEIRKAGLENAFYKKRDQSSLGGMAKVEFFFLVEEAGLHANSRRPRTLGAPWTLEQRRTTLKHSSVHSLRLGLYRDTR